MILIGRYLSPFVRRVATTLELYGMEFEHRPLQHTGDDAPKLRQYNPVGRVPALILDDDRVLVESAAILDHLDRAVGPERALTPAAGEPRDRALTLLGIATGAIDKSIATAYEVRFRPEEKRHAPWVERCEDQVRSGYSYLDGQLDGDWYIDGRMSQADISIAIGWQFLGLGNKKLQASIDAPKLDGLLARLMDIPAFSKTLPS